MILIIFTEPTIEIHPGECAFNSEAMFIYRGVEMAFSSPLDPFAVALVLRNIRTDAAVP